MSRSTRIAVLVAFVVLAAGAFVVSRPDGDADEPAGTTSTQAATAPAATTPTTTGSPTPPAIPLIRVRAGKPVGGLQTIAVPSGARVRFTIAADTAEEVHVHGYDHTEEVPAGGRASFDFPADLEGILGPRSRPVRIPRCEGGHALAILDAARHGRVHLARAVAALQANPA